tara:strand:+ start:201 stop:464 length:264 start_codon:yes stop_codon:yes gene_type:complete
LTAFNHYSIIHIVIWFIIARYTKIGWLLFLTLSIGWELLELFLPFDFAVEAIQNKMGDIFVNIFGYGFGKRTKKSVEVFESDWGRSG